VNEKVRECANAQFLAKQLFREKKRIQQAATFPVHKLSLDNRLPWLPILNTAELIIKNGYMESVMLSSLLSAI